ncbi:3-deoxy-manno-octulosonate cytidylyltransferase [Thiobaca trueperi]|uniref:3-deoxy-manno-octulosonate cytidylyltransferase n=1 Tax=Thiobaca trueperi TaxID=127458 RepID=A0A4R3N3A9_9GAMM|nr:3-deoxy-manno-octulosonate cytidylyltransferase [Thiobaca trueperi]TCT21159.1 3-deoxy-manno-octulosonate cytidylyltransferase (CMP-KDO synthetase) [Thiobaca trueperi]
MTSGFKVVIPARYGSTRLPGKPLLDIAGKPMIRHVIERALESAAAEILVAADDPRIIDACAGSGVEAMLTDAAHRSGTDRVAEVIERRGWDDETIVVNLQGDEPCMPAALIDQVAADLGALAGVGMSTLAYPIHDSAILFDPHAVKVVTDAAGFALYFSRAPIPWHRDEFLGQHHPVLPATVGFLRHIGLYAYRAAFLKRYVAWEPAPLELAESLEQLRVLWHGERIHVSVAAEEPGPGVDTADDLARAVRQSLLR